MDGGLVAERRLLEAEIEPLALHDRERVAEPFIIGAEAEEAADDRLVRAVPLAGAGEGPVQFDQRLLGGPGHEVPRDEAETTRAGGVAG